MQELSSQGLAQVSVRVDYQPLPVYLDQAGAAWVAGLPGREFELRVVNTSASRIEVITSVDGQDVQKPQAADKYRSVGLVIPAGHTYDFKGYRLNDHRTAAFKFGMAGTGASVASKLTGSDANSGVIGFAIYTERVIPPTYRPTNDGFAGSSYSSTLTHGVPMAAAAPVASSMATEAGEVREDRVGRTEFQRGPSEPLVLIIRYDTADALRAKGVIGLPDPFPGQGTGYEALISE